MLSFWEKTELLHYDLVVLGGGITGMFCALSSGKLKGKKSKGSSKWKIYPKALAEYENK